MSRNAGFTLVELVIVIILLGILSVAVVPLFSSPSSYASRLASDQFLSQFQLAQRVALGMSAQSAPVSMRITTTSEGWDVSVLKTGQVPFNISIESAGARLFVNNSVLNVGQNVSYAWDSAANIVGGANTELRIEGNRTYRVCLSASGYAYRRDAGCL